jgi:hypothetical protein
VFHSRYLLEEQADSLIVIIKLAKELSQERKSTILSKQSTATN